MSRDNKGKAAVIRNIQEAVVRGDFNTKVQNGEPVLSPEEEVTILNSYLKEKNTAGFRIKNMVVTGCQQFVSCLRNIKTEYYGIHNLDGLVGIGGIITSNHFNPLENTAVLRIVKKMKRSSKLFAVSQMSNFVMPGIVGFILRYANVIPLCRHSREYLTGRFIRQIEEITENGDYVLIYPEQEMWYNYRKPRPLKPGAYRYAAILGLPVISCFVEIRDEKVLMGIWNTRYIVHILPVIYPDKDLNVREAAEKMMEIDYMQKKTAYEAAYGKALDYSFENTDIAGGMK